MQLRLKKEYFENYTESFLNNVCSLIITEKLITLEINYDPLIHLINPYIFDYVKRTLDNEINVLYYNRNYLGRAETDGNKTFINIKEYEDQVSEDFKNIVLDLKEAANKLLSDRILIGFECEIIDEYVVVENNSYNITHFEKAAEPLLTVEIFTSIDDFLNLKKTNPQMKNIKYVNDVSRGYNFNSKKIEEAFIVLFKDGLVIGVNHIAESYERPGYFASRFTAIIEEEQKKGYSKLILEKRIEYLKNMNQGLHTSLYSSEGFNYLRPNILELCSKFDVGLIENGLLGIASSFPEAVYSMQKQLIEKIKNAKIYKQEYVFLANFNNVLIKDIEQSAECFLSENAHLLDSKEKQLKFYHKYSDFLDEWIFNEFLK